MRIYDINGNELSVNAFSQNMSISTGIFKDTFYYAFRIFKTKSDGSKQYPFVYCPDNGSGATMSTLEMQERDKFDFAINSGFFDAFQGQTLRPYGITIQNGVVIREDDSYNSTYYHLTIDANGDLSYGIPMASGGTGASFVSQGVKSCVLGYFPAIVNYKKSQESIDINEGWLASHEIAQRQILGQYANGDYAVITCEARSFDNSVGLWPSDVQDLCLQFNLKFAMILDGGGSVETCIGTKQVNLIYENEKGRKVPTFVVFNGSTNFVVP
jgi:exopolysaccharide biosynthesis protein